MKKIISILLCAAIVFSLSACSITKGNAVFTMGINGTITTFDPMLAVTDGENILSANCFEGLLRFDSQGKINLAGATAYTIEKNGLSYVFKLNPNACWHIDNITKETLNSLGLKDFDAAITADCYVYAFERYKSVSKELDIIKEIEATDNFTLSITLSQKDCDFLYRLASLPFYPYSKEFCEAVGDSYGASPATVLFNGPYYIKESSAARTVIERSSHYNGNIQIKNKQVVLCPTEDKDTLEKNFNNGSFNLFLADEFTDSLEVKEPSCVSYDSVWGIVFNCKSKLGSSKTFREILFGSILSLSEISLPAFATSRAECIFPKNFTVNDTVYSDFEHTEMTVETNTEKAADSLNALQKKFKKTSYTVNFAAPYDMKAAAEKIAENWEMLFDGKLTVNISLYNRDEALEIAETGLYDIAIMPLFTKDNTAYSLLDSVYYAPCYYESEQLNALKTKIGTVAEKNLEIFSQAEKHLIENCVFMPLFYTGKSLCINDGFKGFYIADGGKLTYFYAGEEL